MYTNEIASTKLLLCIFLNAFLFASLKQTREEIEIYVH